MGIREKSDFNLQFVSLGCALFTLMFFAAAQNYTLDWRERRIMKRQLKIARKHIESMAESKQARRKSMSYLNELPEVSDDSNPESLKQRRGWKRFIAALPLMPLATAYIVVRLGWDVFELLVFCTIDFMLNAATHSVSTLRTVVAGMQTLATDLATWLDLRQRMVSAAIAITETTVVWTFNTVLPAIGSLISYCLDRCVDFGHWWQEVGGPALRDFIELAVLDYVVPAWGTAAEAISAAYMRMRWLAEQIWKAASMVSWDLARDLAILWQWIGAASVWVRDHGHWVRSALHLLLPSSGRIRMVKAFVGNTLVPWVCTKAAVAYERALRPTYRVCVRAGDHAIQFVIESALLLVSRLQACTVWARLMPLLRKCRHMLKTGAWLAKGILAAVIPSLARAYLYLQTLAAKYSWVIHCSHAVYARAREMVLPWLQAMATRVSQLWAFTVSHMGRLVSGTLVARLRHVVWSIAAAVFRRIGGVWCEMTAHMSVLLQQLQPLRFIANIHAWIQSSVLVGYVHRLVANYLQLLLVRINTMAVGLWPLAMQGWQDSVQVLAEMCRQLASAVDMAVAMIGDFIVDFARRNTIHGDSASDRVGSVYDNDNGPS